MIRGYRNKNGQEISIGVSGIDSNLIYVLLDENGNYVTEMKDYINSVSVNGKVVKSDYNGAIDLPESAIVVNSDFHLGIVNGGEVITYTYWNRILIGDLMGMASKAFKQFMCDNIKNHKILFLDFDGVLNSFDNMRCLEYLHKLTDKRIKSQDQYGDLFDERCVNWLHYIILKTDCKLVISSSRKYAGVEKLRKMFCDRKVEGHIVDRTPNIDDDFRGNEIQAFIDKYDITNYCIIDDHNDMLESQLDRFVLCDGRFGLTSVEARKVVEILNGKAS